MKQKLNLDTWNRKEHFLFFKQMQEPFFGVTVTIDCTKAYENAKAKGISFFTYYLYKTLEAVNAHENFRYRISGDEVHIYNRIDVSATILRDDKTFGFSYIEFDNDLSVFAQNTKTEITRIQNTTGLLTTEYPENLIHFSALPWINFTSFSHARNLSLPDSCPKISFGKMMDENRTKTMSMSIHVHHGLMDGYHVGEFVALFQELMDAS